MAKIKSKKEVLIDAVKSVPVAAEKERWVITFDKEEGTLFYSPRRIPDGAALHQVTDEYALYLDKQMNPHGVMIEYFDENFIKHHRPLRLLSKAIFKGRGKVQVIDPKTGKRNEKIAALAALLESTLIKDAGIRPIFG